GHSRQVSCTNLHHILVIKLSSSSTRTCLTGNIKAAWAHSYLSQATQRKEELGRIHLHQHLSTRLKSTPIRHHVDGIGDRGHCPRHHRLDH
ncbi:hypothetical protein QQF64_017604, partial [Cirrhinus molitorella]